jgi:hypothetical protein
MANITQTPANVTVIGEVGTIDRVTGGESITQGMPVYLASTGRWLQHDANTAAAASSQQGIAMQPCSGDGVKFGICKTKGATINLGATLVKGTVYVVSATKGAICPQADLTTGDYVQILGIADTTSTIKSLFEPTGILL